MVRHLPNLETLKYWAEADDLEQVTSTIETVKGMRVPTEISERLGALNMQLGVLHVFEGANEELRVLDHHRPEILWRRTALTEENLASFPHDTEDYRGEVSAYTHNVKTSVIDVFLDEDGKSARLDFIKTDLADEYSRPKVMKSLTTLAGPSAQNTQDFSLKIVDAVVEHLSGISTLGCNTVPIEPSAPTEGVIEYIELWRTTVDQRIDKAGQQLDTGINYLDSDTGY